MESIDTTVQPIAEKNICVDKKLTPYYTINKYVELDNYNKDIEDLFNKNKQQVKKMDEIESAFLNCGEEINSNILDIQQELEDINLEVYHANRRLDDIANNINYNIRIFSEKINTKVNELTKLLLAGISINSVLTIILIVVMCL